MKRIGTFLFVDQWFKDLDEPMPAIININMIDNVCCNLMVDKKQHTVVETPSSKIVLVGEHFDNMIRLSELLNDDKIIIEDDDIDDDDNFDWC